MATVKSGTKLLSIPVAPLGNSSCAVAKRIAGKRFPKRATIQMAANFLFHKGKVFNCLYARGSITIPEINILYSATCRAEKDSNPRFISINELPQISANSSNERYCLKGVFI